MVKRNTEDLVNELSRKKDECAGKKQSMFLRAHTKIYSETSADVKFLCCDMFHVHLPNSENAHDIFYLYGCRIGGCSSALPELEFVGQLSMRMGQMREWVASGCCPVGYSFNNVVSRRNPISVFNECRTPADDGPSRAL
ncbi:hypothetical protein niasHT_036895 [Heterodera trifolii]|uniref:Uncharacterized protein n=1 Tax=Heterodera trifolii TaxID=157864 RepID=A0ABD2IEA9_9BILA